tara:strand:- start:142 stop:306 length:165 start_codon:yes stop_codon:yes gene_type:complete
MNKQEIIEALMEEEATVAIPPSFLICSGCGCRSPTFTSETDGEQWFSAHECGDQ